MTDSERQGWLALYWSIHGMRPPLRTHPLTPAESEEVAEYMEELRRQREVFERIPF